MIVEPGRVVLAAHMPLHGDARFPNAKPRGGETSVGIIRDHLAETWDVLTIVKNVDDFSEHIRKQDVVLTWGIAAEEVMRYCYPRGIPYVLMVRWWRNVCPLPPGDLMKREIDKAFVATHDRLFRRASAIITNNRYSARVLKRWYSVKAVVSYVSVAGELRPGSNPKGHVLFVTDNKGVRGAETVRAIANLMPSTNFLVVNAFEEYPERNILAIPYQRDMDSIYERVSVLINPIYDHDGCGTGRVMMEAMRHCIPVLGMNRAGLMENGGTKLPRNATANQWARAIENIRSNYPSFQAEACRAFDRHDAMAELDVYTNQIEGLFE